MPKEEVPFPKFDVGQVNVGDPADIPQNALWLAKNVTLRENGMIIPQGSFVAHGASNITPITNPDIRAGNGLYAFNADYQRDGTGGETHYLIHPDHTNKVFDVYELPDGGIGGWNYGEITFNNGNSIGDVVYNYIDGALRITANMLTAGASVCEAGWYGYINRQHAYSTSAFNGFFAQSNALTPPGSGFVVDWVNFISDDSGNSDTNTAASTTSDFSEIESELDKGTYNAYQYVYDDVGVINSATNSQLETSTFANPWDGLSGFIYPPAGDGFGVHVTITSGSESTLQGGTYEFAETFIYDGVQETQPAKVDGTITITDGDYIQVRITMSGPFNERISGGRLYTRLQDSNDEWQLVTDIDLNQGVRATPYDEYREWTRLAPGVVLDTAASEYAWAVTGTIASLGDFTFENLNGFNQDVSSISIEERIYADMIQLSRRMVGASSDRLYYTPVDRFDTFPTNFYVTLGLNDGDRYTALSTQGDVLLAFKENIAYAINTSAGEPLQWYTMDEYPQYGVESASAVTETPFGTVIVNKRGCYIFDGRRFQRISAAIDEDEWKSTITTDVSVGYSELGESLIIIADASSSGTGETYIYDIGNQRWYFGTELFTASRNLSNFTVDWDGNLVLASDGGTSLDVLQYDETPVSKSDIDIQTIDFQGRFSGKVKKYYGVLINYKAGTSHSTILEYRLDGSDGSWTQVADSIPSKSNYGYEYIEIASTGVEGHSIQLRLKPASTDDIRIKEIVLITRTLRAKRR